MSTLSEDLGRRVSEVRRQAGETSLLAFARTYLPAHCRLPPSLMHREISAQLEDASRNRGARFAVAAPRGHAKSTLVSLVYLLWSICYRASAMLPAAPRAAEAPQGLCSVVYAYGHNEEINI